MLVQEPSTSVPSEIEPFNEKLVNTRNGKSCVVSGSINQYSEQKIAHCMATAVCGVSPGTRGDSVSNSGRGTENCDRGASTTWSTAQEEDMSEPWGALQSMATVCKQRLAGWFIRSGLKPG